MKMWILVWFVVVVSAGLHEELPMTSPRNIIVKLFRDINVNATTAGGLRQLVRLSASPDNMKLLMEYLTSDDHLHLLELLEGAEKECLFNTTCKKRTDLIDLFIHYEKTSISKLQPLFSELVDVYNIDDETNYVEPSKWTMLQNGATFINIVLALVLVSISLSKLYQSRLSLPVAFVTVIFVVSMIIGAWNKYEEKEAARFAYLATVDGNPCAPANISERIFLLLKSIIVKEEKSACQQYIESQTISVLSTILPVEVFMNVVGWFAFGWLPPLGTNLSSFVRELLPGYSWIGEFILSIVSVFIAVVFITRGFNVVHVYIRTVYARNSPAADRVNITPFLDQVADSAEYYVVHMKPAIEFYDGNVEKSDVSAPTVVRLRRSPRRHLTT